MGVPNLKTLRSSVNFDGVSKLKIVFFPLR
jgi:hypothetical protein